MAKSKTVQQQVRSRLNEKNKTNQVNIIRVQQQMEGMSGRQVLGMQREALEAAFGKEEGSRLDSQIILSR